MSDAKSSGANPLQLVHSSRLQALRAKSEAAQSQAPETKSAVGQCNASDREDAETARLRGLIDQCLQRILASMPSGKQQRLFKIRFGVTPEQIKSLPPQEAARRLKIKIR